ncbi:MAG TPA: hypothetical protein VNI34_03105 [Candidatus Nitrosotalea sp.]|nr:hypothetical protein [Candidatus Nitrosotalea sp.]
MRHLDDGALRRMYDEPLSLDGERRDHFNLCSQCQERLQEFGQDARWAQELLAVPGATVDPQAALVRLRSTLISLPTRARRSRRPRLRVPLVAAALAAALVGVLAFTPLAQTLTSVFTPQTVTPVTLQPGSLRGLDSLSSYGTVKWSGQPQLVPADTALAASVTSHLGLINPGYLPSSLVGKAAAYTTMAQASATFTFSSAKAAAAARAAGRSAPSFAPGLDGSTLKVVVGPAEAAVYGDVSQFLGSAGSPSPAPSKLTAGTFLAVAETRAPVVSSSGVSVSQLKQVLLSQPGLTPQLKQLILSLDVPTGNLPIPIPADMASAQSVSIHGVSGTAVGDNTGLGSGVIWITNGVVHVVAGTVSQNDAIAVANSLG